MIKRALNPTYSIGHAVLYFHSTVKITGCHYTVFFLVGSCLVMACIIGRLSFYFQPLGLGGAKTPKSAWVMCV